MKSVNDVLRCLEGELAWAVEGSPPGPGEPHVLWSVVPDWSGFRIIKFECRDSIAVCTDFETFFEDGLDQVKQKYWVQTLNPWYLAFRLIDRDTGVRGSVVLIREDLAPSTRDLGAIPHVARCHRDVVHLRARAAGVTFN